MKFWLVIFWCFLSAIVSAEESILSFHSRIEVQRNGDLIVTETISVSSEENVIRHGIFRDLPQLYRGKFGLREKRSFEVLSVTRDDVPEPYVIENHEAGVRIRIGSESTFIPTGIHTYAIRYRTDRQLTTYETHDELYWNVTGNEWAFPILESSAEVILPEGISLKSIEGYIGAKGSKERPPTSNTESAGTISAGRKLFPDEGFTIVATWAAKSLDPAAYPSASSLILRDNPLLLVAVGLLVAMLVWHICAWIIVGRDPSPGIIIPQFGPPDGWSPAAVRMLDRMGFDNVCFSAAVMGLAVKKRLTIGGTKKIPKIERVSSPPDIPLTVDEVKVFDRLLGNTASLSLIQTNHANIAAARSALETSLRASIEKSHFRKNIRYWLPGFLITLVAVGLLLIGSPEPAIAGFMLLWLSIWSIGTGALLSSVISNFRNRNWLASIPSTLFALPFVVGWLVGVGVLFASAGLFVSASFIFGVVANFLFYHWIKAPTRLGRKVLDHIEGFRHYLSVAEDDRLKSFIGPEKTPELFEQFLPYAHALGVEQKWSDKFSAILAAAAKGDTPSTGYRPSFYTGSYTGFDGAMAAAALGGALTSALTSASASPSSSGSGSVGGGSSGGGGGGGGGGGW